MEYSANNMQNPAKLEQAKRKDRRDSHTFHKGFLFEPPGGFVLTNCAACARVRPAGESQCHAYPAANWVLDFSLEYSESAGFLCGTESSGLLQRPARMAHLYPPAISYLEKTDRECWVSSAWMTFQSDVGFLRELTLNPSGFARIHDPFMKIGRRLETIASIAAAGGNASYFRCVSIAFEIMAELAAARPIPATHGEYTTASESSSVWEWSTMRAETSTGGKAVSFWALWAVS